MCLFDLLFYVLSFKFRLIRRFWLGDLPRLGDQQRSNLGDCCWPLTTFFRAFFLIQIGRCRWHVPLAERPTPSVAAIPSPTLYIYDLVVDRPECRNIIHTYIHHPYIQYVNIIYTYNTIQCIHIHHMSPTFLLILAFYHFHDIDPWVMTFVIFGVSSGKALNRASRIQNKPWELDKKNSPKVEGGV